MSISKSFIDKVLKERIVDTRKYRYFVKEVYGLDAAWLEVRRLPIEWLDTTAALDSWETVAVIK